MSNTARIGYGTTILLDGDEIGQVVDFGVGGISVATINATHYKSPDKFEEFIAGLIDGGEVTLVTQAPPEGVAEFSGAFGNIAPEGDDVFPDDGTKVRIIPIAGTSLPSPLEVDTDYYIFEDPPDTGDPPTGEYYLTTDAEGQNVISTGAGEGFLVPSEDYWYQIFQRLQFRTVRELKVVFPNEQEFEADILVTNFGVSAPNADKITTSVTFKITGETEWAE